MNKTTKDDFELFKFRCNRWQKFFGLINYDISYRHIKDEEDARCAYNIPGKWAIIILSTELNDYEYCKTFIRNLALHEICELLVGSLGHMARGKYSIDEVEIAEHEIVMRLINVLLPLEDVIFKDEPKKSI